jgi:hypothetical protein
MFGPRASSSPLTAWGMLKYRFWGPQTPDEVCRVRTPGHGPHPFSASMGHRIDGWRGGNPRRFFKKNQIQGGVWRRSTSQGRPEGDLRAKMKMASKE